jgi:hypothetical protein
MTTERSVASYGNTILEERKDCHALKSSPKMRESELRGIIRMAGGRQVIPISPRFRST